MENYIWLSNYKYVPTNIRKPYFKTIENRDDFISTLTKLYVNKTGVNINLINTFEFRVIVNKDITDVYDKNFACLCYNDKEFYCDIIETTHISKDRTQLICSINPFFQYINYLSFFSNFQLSKCTGNSKLLFGKNSKFIFNKNYRTYQYIPSYEKYAMFYEEDENYDIIGTDIVKLYDSPGNWWFRGQYDIVYLDCLIISCEADPKDLKFINSEFSNYDTLVIPLFTSYPKNTVVGATLLLRKIDTYDIETTSINRDGSIEDFQPLVDKINKFTPSATSFRMAKLPFVCGEETDTAVALVPLFYYTSWDKYGTNSVILKIRSTTRSLNYRLINDCVAYDIDLTDIAGNVGQMDKFTIYFGGFDNKITINLSDYISETSTKLTILLTYILDANGDKIAYSVFSDGNSSKLTNATLRSVIDLKDTITYAVDSEEKFNAENRYYDELTKNAQSSRIGNGIIQGATELATGISQISFGAIDFFAGGGSGGIANGFGNIYRAIGTAASTVTGYILYEEQRDLERKNAQARPDEFISGTSVGASLQFFDDGIKIVGERIIDADWNSISNEIKISGCKCSLFFEDCYSLLDFILDEGNETIASVAATCEISSSDINANVLNVIQEILKTGLYIDYYGATDIEA